MGRLPNVCGGIMKAIIITPRPVDGTLGNSITAQRWADILRTLGHDVTVAGDWAGEDYDLLIGLHARRSHATIKRFREAYPARPAILALTGTDLYRDLPASSEARESLSLATRIVALQEAAREELDIEARAKT